ncbi:DNA repair exonuclease, partial [bacterium]|nr:DNA repair exonuclease [bacterium]
MKENIRFAHLADLHLGAFREKTLTNLNFLTFKKAIEKIIEEKLDFALFSGDIFNNAMPPLELVQKVTIEIMKLKKAQIPLYIIGGSHDYTLSQNSFIELLAQTQIFYDLSKPKFLENNKVELKFIKDTCGANISGILGKKNGLDKLYYENLNETNLEKNKLNIFMFHALIDDFKPDFLKSISSNINKSFLPKGFDYYAGGHVHTHMQGKYDTGIISYPGPLFPNNFSELKTEEPSFNLCEFETKTRNLKIERIFIKTYEKILIKIDLDELNPIFAREKILREIEKYNLENKIILLELKGIIEGKINDIGISSISQIIYEKGAKILLKNTYKLTSSLLK